MRYCLRTLLIVLAVGPPVLASAYYTAWLLYQPNARHDGTNVSGVSWKEAKAEAAKVKPYP